MGCVVKGRKCTIKFLVADVTAVTILGLPTCEGLGLLQRVDDVQYKIKIKTREHVLHDFKDVFQWTGRYEGKCHLSVDPAVTPIIHLTRAVPLSLHDKLKQMLDKLETRGNIKKVQYPTKWVNQLVVSRGT